MKIAIEINDIIRDVFLKAAQVYEKFYIESKDDEIVSEYDQNTDEWIKTDSDEFEFGLNLPVDSLELINHFKFKNNEDLYDFFYVDFPMQIFGHAPSVSANTFNIINDLYINLRDNNEVTLISDEMGKSKPATLFFLSKYGSLIENIKFYSNVTIENIINEFDVIVTTNPSIIQNKNKKPIIVKYNTLYNSSLISDYEINSVLEIEPLIKKIINK
jgi:hypothetical protein